MIHSSTKFQDVHVPEAAGAAGVLALTRPAAVARTRAGRAKARIVREGVRPVELGYTEGRAACAFIVG